jgi:hypothetical protein
MDAGLSVVAAKAPLYAEVRENVRGLLGKRHADQSFCY